MSHLDIAQSMELFDEFPAKRKAVNVASVPQRSPFRYPGGKTWLVPVIRDWLSKRAGKGSTLVEPFVGGGIVSLTAVMEGFVDRAIICELDEEISAVWKTVMGNHGNWLVDQIMKFDLTHENVQQAIENRNQSVRQMALSTILKNRCYHGGILAPGSGLLKHGENGKGINSRWYPETLRRRILSIIAVKEKFEVIQGDAFELLDLHRNRKDFLFFIDPPYTKAGKRLYTHFQVDHEELVRSSSKLKGDFLLTYDDADEIAELAEKYSLETRKIPMKTTMHREKLELLIGSNLDWVK